MSKWLLPIICICCVAAGCSKDQTGLIHYKQQAAADDKIVLDYIKANGLDSAKKVSDTSGVYYIIKQAGQGNDLYTSSTYVTVVIWAGCSDKQRLFTRQITFTLHIS